MNWPEFVAACEARMKVAEVDPTTVVMRVEVSDSYYDKDITDRNQIQLNLYGEIPHLIIWGD